MFHHPYSSIGVEMSATDAEIRKAYRTLALKHHPDKGGDPEKFKEITHAYEVLSDSDQRREYDQLCEEVFEEVMCGDPDGTPDPAPSSWPIVVQQPPNFAAIQLPAREPSASAPSASMQQEQTTAAHPISSSESDMSEEEGLSAANLKRRLVRIMDLSEAEWLQLTTPPPPNTICTRPRWKNRFVTNC